MMLLTGLLLTPDMSNVSSAACSNQVEMSLVVQSFRVDGFELGFWRGFGPVGHRYWMPATRPAPLLLQNLPSARRAK